MVQVAADPCGDFVNLEFVESPGWLSNFKNVALRLEAAGVPRFDGVLCAGDSAEMKAPFDDGVSGGHAVVLVLVDVCRRPDRHV